ncbi:hypothetical protein Glove_43g85 [Diversispora epigaea]|uniref:Uncharacterized protein n=1 Tax=Diversispora epigaea TaxID=1348612 RepID=A0A397JNX3_9GLOM|nr:hypothetical protein Glove_43g85 [Diversispora epigaea]
MVLILREPILSMILTISDMLVNLIILFDNIPQIRFKGTESDAHGLLLAIFSSFNPESHKQCSGCFPSGFKFIFFCVQGIIF